MYRYDSIYVFCDCNGVYFGYGCIAMKCIDIDVESYYATKR